MEYLEQLKAWLMAFPLWGDAPPAVDLVREKPGHCALFPVGLEVVSVREDVLGNFTARLRQQFLLRRNAPRGEDAAAWGMAFTCWVNENAATAPVFGHRQQLRAEKSRLVSSPNTGLGIYEVRLTIEYEKEQNYG